METNAMGRVLAAATIENLVELYNAENGIIAPEQVHRLQIPDALVDTGATYLSMPKRLIEKLGFRKPFTQMRFRTARGPVTADLYGPVRLTIQDRFCTIDISETVSDEDTVLIGQVPLELLDFVVDPRWQRLIGNPAHGGQQIYDMF
jgi:predicted aspartyl protease